eukprot:gene2019-3925_t
MKIALVHCICALILPCAFSKVPPVLFKIAHLYKSKLESSRNHELVVSNSKQNYRSPPTTSILSTSYEEYDFSVTEFLIITNVVIYILTKGIPGFKWMGLSPKGDRALLNNLMKVDSAIARGQIYRLFTGSFCHGSLNHLIFNCLSLSSIGPESEKTFGKGRFAAIYMGSGVLADIATYLMKTSPYSLGASGCIFGLTGAMGSFYLKNRDRLGSHAEQGIESIKRTLVINLIYGLSTSSRIDHHAHIAGFLSGGLLGFIMGPRQYFTGYKY